MYPNIFFHCYPTPRRTVNELSNLPDTKSLYLHRSYSRRWFTRYNKQAMGWAIHESIPGRGSIFFLFSKYSRLVLGPTQWEPGFLPEGKSDLGVKYATHLHLVPRLRISGALPLRNHGTDIGDFNFLTWTSD